MHKGPNFVFIHIPKTGGLSVLDALGLESLGHARLGKRIPNRFTFAFVRNPFDRLVSAFFYLNKGGINEWDERDRKRHIAQYRGDFQAFVKGALGESVKQKLFQQQHFKPQWHWIGDGRGDIFVDFVGRFENFEADFAHICQKIGRPGLKLPKKNQTQRKDWREYYDATTQKIVEQAYAGDLQRFNYSFH